MTFATLYGSTLTRLPKRKDELASALSLCRMLLVSRFICAFAPRIEAKCRQFHHFPTYYYSFIHITLRVASTASASLLVFVGVSTSRSPACWALVPHGIMTPTTRTTNFICKCSNVAFMPPFSLYFITDFKFNRIEFFHETREKKRSLFFLYISSPGTNVHDLRTAPIFIRLSVCECVCVCIFGNTNKRIYVKRNCFKIGVKRMSGGSDKLFLI